MSCIKRKPFDYSCPVCGELLDTDIVWDPANYFEAGFTHLWGVCTCGCGAKVIFEDVYTVTETNVEVVE